MPDTKPPFQFWRFFFSPQGRIGRKAILYFALPLKSAIYVAGWFVTREVQAVMSVSPQALIGSPWLYAQGAIGLIDLLLLWPVFALVTKRLHDLNLPAVLGFPPFVLLAGIFVPPLMLWADIRPTSEYITISRSVFYWISVYHHLLILAVAIAPGMKTANRYGPAPGETTLKPADHF